MRQRAVVAVLMAISATGAVFACGGDKRDPAGTCGTLTAPGIVISSPGIQVELRTNQGQPAASGASITATSANGAVLTGFAVDSLTLIEDVPAGTYGVRITKPAYRDTTIANVVVLPGQCNHPLTTKLTVAIQSLSGAASVRSVGVAGAEFLATPGSRTRLTAFVDADAGISRAVTWQLSDTTMATVDESGVVTARCSAHGGSERATATSVANGAVSGSVSFGIGASGSC